ncbi:MAG: HAD family hydrolase [Oscillospiraceae bacterium]
MPYKKDFDKNKYKLAAFDIDGTIFSGGKILPSTADALDRLSKSGVEVVLSTGRHPSYMPKPILEMDCFRYAVAANGSIVSDIKSGEVIFIADIDRLLTIKIAEFLAERTDEFHLVFREGGLLTRPDLNSMRAGHSKEDADRIEENVRCAYTIVDGPRELIAAIKEPSVKYGCRTRCVEEANQLKADIMKSFPIEAVSTDSGIVEITAKNVTKGHGLEILCDKLGISVDATMAFGDSGNDIEIMKRAAFSVAMGNATDDVKEIADFVTTGVMDDGAGAAIRELFGI